MFLECGNENVGFKYRKIEGVQIWILLHTNLLLFSWCFKRAQSKKIITACLNNIVEYATLKEIDIESLIAIIEWPIDNHLILQTKGMYPILYPTYEGFNYGFQQRALVLN